MDETKKATCAFTISVETKAQESMLGMRIRISPNFSFGATCGPIEALRGDYVLSAFHFIFPVE